MRTYRHDFTVDPTGVDWSSFRTDGTIAVPRCEMRAEPSVSLGSTSFRQVIVLPPNCENWQLKLARFHDDV